MTALVPYGDRSPSLLAQNQPAQFLADAEACGRTRSVAGVSSSSDVAEPGDRGVEVGCDDPWRIRQPTDWRLIGRVSLVVGATVGGAAGAFTGAQSTTGAAVLLAASVAGVGWILRTNSRARRLDPTRQPVDGPTPAAAPGNDLEPAGWVWRCRPCTTVSIEVLTEPEAVDLAAVHDLLHHGTRRTAAIVPVQRPASGQASTALDGHVRQIDVRAVCAPVRRPIR